MRYLIDLPDAVTPGTLLHDLKAGNPAPSAVEKVMYDALESATAGVCANCARALANATMPLQMVYVTPSGDTGWMPLLIGKIEALEEVLRGQIPAKLRYAVPEGSTIKHIENINAFPVDVVARVLIDGNWFCSTCYPAFVHKSETMRHFV